MKAMSFTEKLVDLLVIVRALAALLLGGICAQHFPDNNVVYQGF